MKPKKKCDKCGRMFVKIWKTNTNFYCHECYMKVTLLRRIDEMIKGNKEFLKSSRIKSSLLNKEFERIKTKEKELWKKIGELT